jgi:alkanesulfonate monooxygenase SsuD/methylene tetrahydromethanopterin reductase-like flavin-dependent oxidoreductase (luciferase family)
MVFVDSTTEKAKARAEKAWLNYWKAMEGTIDQKKVDQAVSNTLAGDPDTLAAQIRAKYNAGDRLMLWFDFNNHDNEQVKRSMIDFMEKVVPQLPGGV